MQRRLNEEGEPPQDTSMKFVIYTVACFCCFFFGCHNNKDSVNQTEAYFLKSGNLVISEREFSEELELKRSAYDYGIQKKSDEFNAFIIHLVDQLSEELVLRRGAEDKGILVSEEEIKAAEDNIRADYPEDSFENMLIEHAVTYEFWRHRLKLRLLFDRLIQEDLRDRIEITPKDMVAYYDKVKGSLETFQHEAQNEAVLVANLRMEKAEAEYPDWIKKLGEIYPVLINRSRIESYVKSMKINKP